MHILYLNGPNLNLLGTREPEIYGSHSLLDIENMVKERAVSHKIQVDFFQSNSESKLIEILQNTRKNKYDGVVLNAGAFTHTSIALRDAAIACGVAIVELHLSNIYAREEFRHKSFLSDVAIGVICGFGAYGYCLALDGLRVHLQKD